MDTCGRPAICVIAEEGIIRVGENESASKAEKKLWSRVLRAYELFSRSRGIPVLGKPLFFVLDSFRRTADRTARTGGWELTNATWNVGPALFFKRQIEYDGG